MKLARQRGFDDAAEHPATSVTLAPNDGILSALTNDDRCFMNIRAAKVDELAQQLARLTGEDVETALERAIAERLSRLAPASPADRKAAMASFFERASRVRILDLRPVDEIVGYDGRGLPA